MSAANPNPMEKSMVSVLVVENAGGGVAIGSGRHISSMISRMSWRLFATLPARESDALATRTLCLQ
jgi:hypothetical protein